MPYLSKIPLNPVRRGAQRLLRNTQALHASVLSGLVSQPVTERVLWRLESRDHVADLLVLTQSRPSWEGLVEDAGWPGADGGQALVRDYQPLLDRLAVGRDFAFRLTANPTSRVRQPQSPSAAHERALARSSRPRGIRVGHRTASAQLGWLLRRAAGEGDTWGFSLGPVDAARVSLVGRRHDSFRPRRGQPPISLDVATFEGVLRVTDVARFRSALLDGMGGAKAYGCGLMTLAPTTADTDVVAR